jgi:hypothetical protein
MTERTCPQSNDVHQVNICIWCDRKDLVPAGPVSSMGTNCKYCGEMVWLCEFCYAAFHEEWLRRQGYTTVTWTVRS